jgi:hypothetical protein
MKLLDNYKFTNKKHPELGIMSCILGCISGIFMFLTVIVPFFSEKAISPGYGLTCALAFVMAIVGEVFGIITKKRKDTYDLFPLVGIITNSISLAFGIFLIVLGM